MNKHFDIEYKVIIIGESRIGKILIYIYIYIETLQKLDQKNKFNKTQGKTSIIKRLNNQEFFENTVTTLGIDFVNVFYLIDSLLVKLQIW